MVEKGGCGGTMKSTGQMRWYFARRTSMREYRPAMRNVWLAKTWLAMIPKGSASLVAADASSKSWVMRDLLNIDRR